MTAEDRGGAIRGRSSGAGAASPPDGRRLEGYEAAVERCAVVERPPRVQLTMTGRDPGGMLKGIATGSVPGRPRTRDDGALAGRGFYSAILTPKGRMITDLRAFPLVEGEPEFDGEAEDPGYLLDLPRAGLEGVQDHFRRFLPPRLARVRDRSDVFGLVTVVGPEAAALVTGEAPGLGVSQEDLLALEEDAFLMAPGDGVGLRVIRSGDVEPPAFDVLTDLDTAASLRTRLGAAGAEEAGPEVWEVLRVEAGRPAYGPDMDDTVIPVEAGIQDRAIDYGKGCYTGQEVVVMIRDRGKPPRHLRGLLLGSEPPPPAGTHLYVDERDRPVGEVRSAVHSPRFAQTAALGYVRREVEVPGVVRLGRPDGPAVDVRELNADGWGAGFDGA